MVKAILYYALIVLFYQSCAKEYSYEGGVTNIRVDTIRVPVVIDPVCAACINNNSPALSEWSFKSGNWKLCGIIDTAIVDPTRTAFTFYGPSTCSIDTGMVITVYLNNDTLNRDKQNIRIERAGFYSYDRVTPSYIFMSQNSQTFSVTIDNYHHATKIATGTFSGTVTRENGAAASISSGKFHVRLL